VTMRLALTGASGLVGSACAQQAAGQGHEVHGAVGRWPAPVAGLKSQASLDLVDTDAALRWLREVRPDTVLNAAAIAEPAACERDPALSERVNIGLPVALARWAAETGARLVHISTEQVFDGETPPHRIDSPTRPLNLYGRQKLAAEERVRATDPGAAIVRAPLLFGNSLGGRRSVHEKFLEAWAGGKVMRLFTDELRMVCSAENLSAALLELGHRRDLRGVLHWAGVRAVSRWEMGRAICARFGFDEKWIAPASRAEMPDFTASRPRDLTLDLAPLDRELRARPERFEDAVARLALPAWWRGFGAPPP
jgi:dTDP-4-dehydrorhamnose reductase